MASIKTNSHPKHTVRKAYLEHKTYAHVWEFHIQSKFTSAIKSKWITLWSVWFPINFIIKSSKVKKYCFVRINMKYPTEKSKTKQISTYIDYSHTWTKWDDLMVNLVLPNTIMERPLPSIKPSAHTPQTEQSPNTRGNTCPWTIPEDAPHTAANNTEEFVLKRCNSSADALELHLFWTNPST